MPTYRCIQIICFGIKIGRILLNRFLHQSCGVGTFFPDPTRPDLPDPTRPDLPAPDTTWPTWPDTTCPTYSRTLTRPAIHAAVNKSILIRSNSTCREKPIYISCRHAPIKPIVHLKSGFGKVRNCVQITVQWPLPGDVMQPEFIS